MILFIYLLTLFIPSFFTELQGRLHKIQITAISRIKHLIGNVIGLGFEKFETVVV